MANDREQELERLNKELLKTQKSDPVLQADIPIEILEPIPVTWEEPQEEDLTITAEDLADYVETPEEQFAPTRTRRRNENVKKQGDTSLIILMAIASILCIGIISVLGYWLSIFLK